MHESGSFRASGSRSLVAEKGAPVHGRQVPEHDPEKWEPVFGEDHAPARIWSVMISEANIITLQVWLPNSELRGSRMAHVVPTHRLTHEASLAMLRAGVDKADVLGCKVSLAGVDQSCRLIGFLMMDGARHFSIITTQRKAITAASQRQPTGYAPEENALSMAVRMGDFTNVPGGFPIMVAGEVVGAVAAGGAKIDEDVTIAKAALAALDAE